MQHLLSMAERLSLLDATERERLLADLGPKELEGLRYDWDFWARPNQLPPEPVKLEDGRLVCSVDPDCPCAGAWLNWVILAGRGWGKTRTGAEWVNRRVNDRTYGRFHLIGATVADVRDIMIEGPSGIIPTAKPGNRARYIVTKRKIEWENGAIALCFSADEPERLRGEQCEAAWADELAAWRYAEAWKQLQLGLRLGPHPCTVITTTPRPTPLVKRLVKDERNHITKGSTYDNIANLAEAFIREITQGFEGTRFGRQEIYAEILDDNDYALWSRELLDDQRIDPEVFERDFASRIRKIVIGVDPAVSFGEEAAETGIIVAGIDDRDNAYVIGDHSGRYRPEQWAAKVAALYQEYGANKVIAEKNQGYELVRRNLLIEDPTMSVTLVHASKNKITRAEPVATAYERGRVFHVGSFDKLEDDMCSWEAGSPTRPIASMPLCGRSPIWWWVSPLSPPWPWGRMSWPPLTGPTGETGDSGEVRSGSCHGAVRHHGRHCRRVTGAAARPR
jgi:phage terminase large subunit-like protein